MYLYFQNEDNLKALIYIIRCSVCENLVSTWTDLAQHLHNIKDQPVIAQVDCNLERELCGKGYYDFINLKLQLAL